MTPLFDGPAPRVFRLPPGVDFSAEIARGLRARLADHPPEAMARLRLYLNTRRTGRAVTSALEDHAAYLPRIAFVGELEDEARRAGLPGWDSKLRRTLALMRLTEGFMRAEPAFGDPASAPSLAVSLRGLLDELQAAGVDPEDLRRLDLQTHARHWELTARFLTIIAETWPAYLEEQEGGALDPEARRRAAVAALAEEWAARPPAHPVIAAGSTGSTPATAELLAAIARLPQGAVILPGWDPDMPGDVWDELAAGDRPEHPHHHLAQLLVRLGLGPADPESWTNAAPPPERRRLLAQALRPAPVTDAWRAALPDLAAEAPAATGGLTLLEAPNPREEAAAIAAALARAADQGRTAALVTPDKVLARRVTAALARWHVIPDDSAGRPLGLTPPGVLLGLVAGCLGRPLTAETLAALLRHPLVGGEGEARGTHLGHALRLERDGLRGGPQEIDWDRLERRLRRTAADRGRPPDDSFWDWLVWLRATLAPLADGAPDAAGCAALQRATAEALSRGDAAGPGAEPSLWAETAGRDALAFMEDLEAAAPAHGEALANGAWGALWTALIQAEESRRDPRLVHDRIRILGALEARAETAEVMVLGGLNEGVWPAHPAPDPWLSREMRARLHLASPERRIGLAAHDFLQAACAPEAILTRAARDDAGPTVPSRWWVRLENLLKGAAPDALAAAKARGESLLRGADALDHLSAPEDPDHPLNPARRPAPTPPVEARPRRLSVTRVETLIRDPYAIYARHVLRLKPLEPLGRAPGALDMGLALHEVMERFVHATRAWPPEQATPDALRAALLAAADEVLPDAAPWPALRRLWRHRLLRAADWVADTEAARRAESAPLAVETPGARELAGPPAGPFRLTAKADRIDRLADGRLAIYDYKTGAPPGKREIGVFAMQLLLEGCIAEGGGFEGVSAAEVARLEYLALSGSGQGGLTRAADLAEHPLAGVWSRLGELIAAYDEPAQPYKARLRPRSITYAGDYDQLSRHGEWADDGEAVP
ncbi:MAG: double-strand break repair protein AddB [Pseudomonadota bacterium]